MREEEKNIADNAVPSNDESVKYSDSLAIDYCGFRLKSLARKIKSEYLKFKKSETRFINP